MHYNYLGGLRRELHHIKVREDEDGGYEPSLVIISDRFQTKRIDGKGAILQPGRAFVIPLSAMWKYMDPLHYKGDEKTSQADWTEFNQIAYKAKMLAEGKGESGLVCFVPSDKEIKEGYANVLACQFAYSFHKGTSVKLCTGFNLAKCLQMFEIELVPQAAAQLLLWIQSRLDDLKNMPEWSEPENEKVIGEAIMKIGDNTISRDVTVTDTDLAMQAGRDPI